MSVFKNSGATQCRELIKRIDGECFISPGFHPGLPRWYLALKTRKNDWLFKKRPREKRPWTQWQPRVKPGANKGGNLRNKEFVPGGELRVLRVKHNE